MKKYLILFLSVSTLFLISCEKEKIDEQENLEKLSGQWDFYEEYEEFKDEKTKIDVDSEIRKGNYYEKINNVEFRKDVCIISKSNFQKEQGKIFQKDNISTHSYNLSNNKLLIQGTVYKYKIENEDVFHLEKKIENINGDIKYRYTKFKRNKGQITDFSLLGKWYVFSETKDDVTEIVAKECEEEYFEIKENGVCEFLTCEDEELEVHDGKQEEKEGNEKEGDDNIEKKGKKKRLLKGDYKVEKNKMLIKMESETEIYDLEIENNDTFIISRTTEEEPKYGENKTKVKVFRKYVFKRLK